MQSFKLVKFAAVIAATLFAGHAQAAPWTFTTTGTIQSGYDSSGVFGAANTDLYGKSYIMTMVLDHDLYSYQYNYNQQINGYGTLTGSATNTVTVNGVTKSYTFDLSKYNWGQSYLYANPSFTQAYQYQSGTTTGGLSVYGENTIYAWNNATFAQTAANPAFKYQSVAGDYGYANFNVSGNSTYAYFNGGRPQTLSINAAADVPEPAPLALFALGLVAFGVARRKARG